MADTFEETIAQIEAFENTTGLEAGDDCPDCGRELNERNHPRDSQLGVERHEDAPETEIVCRAHGVLESY